MLILIWVCLLPFFGSFSFGGGATFISGVVPLVSGGATKKIALEN